MKLFELSFILILSGWSGMIISFWRHNILIFLITTESMFLGFITFFLLITNSTCTQTGQINALIILTLAALETAIGLCILVHAKNFIDKLSFDSFHVLNG